MERKYARLSRISSIGLPSGRNNLYSHLKKENVNTAKQSTKNI